MPFTITRHQLTRFCLAFLTIGMLFVSNAARADFYDYLRKPEPAYRWEKRGEQKADGVTIYDIHLVSQTWQGIVWQHRILYFVPDKLTYPNFCGLMNTGGNGSGAGDRLLGVAAAKNMEAPFATVFNVPNQPLYNGLTEDALVVYTWEKFLTTRDESWPLHFPMAKSVIKAMDAIQEFSKANGKPVPKDFLVTGASKRGWTAWLVGASKDKRVKAIAPMVIDCLNLLEQGKHQVESYGEFSEQIEDYTAAKIFEKLRSEGGKRLLELEDPYSYRNVLRLPKLIILGTNDRYWTQDALNIYWDDLKGDKWVLYVPNSGHGLEDRTRVLNTLAAFGRTIAERERMPKIKWTYKETPEGVELKIVSDKAPESARLFRTYSKNKDFRTSRWSSEEIEAASVGRNTTYIGKLKRPDSGYAVVFGEVTFMQDGKPYTLSTQVRVFSAPTK